MLSSRCAFCQGKHQRPLEQVAYVEDYKQVVYAICHHCINDKSLDLKNFEIDLTKCVKCGICNSYMLPHAIMKICNECNNKQIWEARLQCP